MFWGLLQNKSGSCSSTQAWLVAKMVFFLKLTANLEGSEGNCGIKRTGKAGGELGASYQE